MTCIPGQSVNVILANGKMYSLDRCEVPEAVAQGAHIASQQEVTDHFAKERDAKEAQAQSEALGVGVCIVVAGLVLLGIYSMIRARIARSKKRTALVRAVQSVPEEELDAELARAEAEVRHRKKAERLVKLRGE